MSRPEASRALRVVLVALLYVGAQAVPGGAEAQTDGPLRIRTISQTGGVQVEIGNLFDDQIAEALDEGFPVRVQLTVALWKDGFFDDRVGEFDWRASARKDGSDGGYRLEVAPGAESQRLDNFPALREALRREVAVPLRPTESGRYYYQLTLGVESLSADDLDELEQWLRGEPTGGSDDNERGALGRGVQRLFVRALGLPSRSLQRRTRPFYWSGGE